jgi:hypothetical protein
MKILRRILHVLAVAAVAYGALVLIRIVAVLLLLKHGFTLVESDAGRAQKFLQSLQTYAPWVNYTLIAFLVATSGLAVFRRLSWKYLVPLLGIFWGVIGYFKWEPAPPSDPDLGPRADTTDEGYRVMMWMSKDSPFSRLPSEVEPNAEVAKILKLPEDKATWPDFVREKRQLIEQAWNGEAFFREWTSAVNARPPVGVWPQGFEQPMLAFQPIRRSLFVWTARAYLLATDGKCDEAVSTLLPMLSAMYIVERTGQNPVHEQIANVVEDRCYLVLSEILKCGSPTKEAQMALNELLNRAPSIQRKFTNAFYGEYESLSEIADSAKTASDASFSIGTTTPKISYSVPMTKRLYLERCARNYEYAMRKDYVGLQALYDASIPWWCLRNPVGLYLEKTSRGIYRKFAENLWQTEGNRLDLLKQLAGGS